MASLVWGRDPQEAYEEPYEYGIQEQFGREARSLFLKLYRLLNSESHRYKVDDRSMEKAVWLLSMDALDSARDCLDSLARKDHRVAGKLFRDLMESMDIAAYFHSATADSRSALVRWYADEVVPHRKYREHVKKTQGDSASTQLAKHYGSLSRFTHRSYHAILDGYILDAKNQIIHDRTEETWRDPDGSSNLLVLAQTISSYYAALASLVQEYMAELSALGMVNPDEIKSAFTSSMEAVTVPRRFRTRREIQQGLNTTAMERKTFS